MVRYDSKENSAGQYVMGSRNSVPGVLNEVSRIQYSGKKPNMASRAVTRTDRTMEEFALFFSHCYSSPLNLKCGWTRRMYMMLADNTRMKVTTA